MGNPHRNLGRLLREDEDGATAIEYGLIAGMIALVLLSIAGAGGAVEGLYNVMFTVANAMG